MGLFKNYIIEYHELKKEVAYFSHECYLKEQRYRELNRKYKELLKEKEKWKKESQDKT